MISKKNGGSILVLVISGFFILTGIVLVTLANGATLNKEEVIQCKARYEALMHKLKAKEQFLDAIEIKTERLLSNQKQWDDTVGELKSINKIKNRLNRLGAEHNIMLSEVTSNKEENLTIDARGSFQSIVEWISAVENEVLLVSFDSLNWSADRGDIVKCLIAIKVMSKGITYDS